MVSSLIESDTRALAEPAPTFVSPTRTYAHLLVGLVIVGAGLRLWRLGFNGLSFDETFTATVGRMPLGHLLDFLRNQDTHPPLDYLLRAPLARAGAGDVVLRMPSAACSIAALVLFALWMRDRRRVGVIATALFACSSFQVFHGGEARMYALLELLGVLAAMLATAWLARPRSAHAAALAAVVTLAVFDHSTGFLLAAGVCAVAGLRRDRAAWIWRAAIVGPAMVWAALWGPSFLHQAGSEWAGWLPRTSPTTFARAVAGQVSDFAPLALVVLAVVALGGWLLWRSDRELGRVWLACGALPFVIAALIGIFSPFLIDRAVTVASWAPVLALAVAGDALIARSRSLGTAVVVGALLAVLAGTVTFLAGKRYDSDLAIAHLDAVTRPGDVVLARPARYAPLPGYRLGVERWNDAATPVSVRGVPDAAGIRWDTAAPTGRIWVYAPVSFTLTFPGFRACADGGAVDVTPWSDGVTKIRCLERATG
jgi:hypothetical protein